MEQDPRSPTEKRSSAQRFERWGPYLAAVSVGVAMTVLMLAFLYSFRQQEYINRQLCQQTVDNRDGNRRTWNAARKFIVSGDGPTDEERDRSTNEFFDAVLLTIPPLRCVGNRPVVFEGP